MGETEGKLGLVLMGGAMLSKSLIQFSVDGCCCVFPLLFELRPNYGGGNEDDEGLLQKVPCTHCYTQWPQSCSRPPPTHTSARDSWTFMDKSRLVSYGVIGHFFLGPGMHKFVCFQGKPFSITVIQVYAPTSNSEDEVEQFYEDL